MSIRYQTEGFLIRKKDQGEADQALTFYTKDFGKIIVLGKGIRKIQSKLKYGAGLLSFSEIEFIQGKNIKTLTDTRCSDSFEGIRNNLECLKASIKICGFLDLFSPLEEKEENIYNLLRKTFREVGNKDNIFLASQYFFWNFLKLMGYQPSLYHCACCQKELSPERLSFDCQEGGVVCKECAGGDSGLIDAETVKFLRLFNKKSFEDLKKIKVLKEHKDSLNKVLSDYVSYFKKSNNLLY